MQSLTKVCGIINRENMGADLFHPPTCLFFVIFSLSKLNIQIRRLAVLQQLKYMKETYIQNFIDLMNRCSF